MSSRDPGEEVSLVAALLQVKRLTRITLRNEMLFCNTNNKRSGKDEEEKQVAKNKEKRRMRRKSRNATVAEVVKAALLVVS